MITVGTARFNFLADNEPFARALNGRWDSFFHSSFEVVVEEVLSAYDHSERVINIDSLSLDLGNIEEDNFNQQFPLRLREALRNYCKENIDHYQAANGTKEGVRITTASMNAFEVFSFFLLHGYLPSNINNECLDLNVLLRRVLDEEAYRFREFLNAYGHYDFVYQRLVFQFTDEQLEQIVKVVQPSESTFINLYIRVQIHTYDVVKKADITRNDYRNAVWTIVLAYLFAESGGYFNRKQIIVHTLRGLAARLNYSFAELISLVTESIKELEHKVEQLPELWSILKDIRQNMQSAIWALDGDFHTCLMREVVAALRSDMLKEEAECVLSPEHLVHILGDADYRRKLLQRLQEKEIHRLVTILIPQESGYILSYASFLDKHKDVGTFTGKAGSEFRLLKWEFIFAVLIAMPASAFSRKQFILSVLQHLAAHYNFSVEELIHWIFADKELKNTGWASIVFPMLEELAKLFEQAKKEIRIEDYPAEEWMGTPVLVRKFIAANTERQMAAWVIRYFPPYGEFMVTYAALLDKGYDSGMLEGKAGGEFRALKWEFIFSYFSLNNQFVFHQKFFVYSVLQRLAAHYNQEIATLISYFMHQVPALLTEYRLGGLKEVLKELYEEHFLHITDSSVIRSKTDRELELWALNLFGATALIVGVQESYLEKWLVYFLDERNQLFRSLWKSGRLNERVILRLVNRTPTLRNLWLRRIKDERLMTVYQRLLSIYAAIRSKLKMHGFIDSQSEYVAVWMVELTARKYLAWSEKEIMDFLIARVHHSAPSSFVELVKKMSMMEQHDEHLEPMRRLGEPTHNDTSLKEIEVPNAGMMLIAPFYPMLFFRLGLLAEDRTKFIDVESRVRAIFLLQYMVYGEQREWREPDLFLNKLLVGMEDSEEPLPCKCELKSEEISMVNDLINAIRSNWDKMRNTSSKAFVYSFLLRKGKVMWHENNSSWEVKVEQKAYDVLLDSLPWSYQMNKFPWSKNVIVTNWR